MQRWTVAGGLLVQGNELLLVRNRRRDGSHDWSPPGGVVDAGESVVDGLTREVAEETGLAVAGWEGPVYGVHVEFPDLGWTLEVSAWLATSWSGVLTVDDPDGVVVDAAFHPTSRLAEALVGSPRWVHEPLCGWADPAQAAAAFLYRAHGDNPLAMRVERLDP